MDGRFLRVNDTICHMLERPREELLGASIIEFTHPDDVPSSMEAVQLLLATGKQEDVLTNPEVLKAYMGETEML